MHWLNECPRVSFCMQHFLKAMSPFISALVNDTLCAATFALIWRAVTKIFVLKILGLKIQAFAILSSLKAITTLPWDWSSAKLVSSFFFSLVYSILLSLSTGQSVCATCAVAHNHCSNCDSLAKACITRSVLWRNQQPVLQLELIMIVFSLGIPRPLSLFQPDTSPLDVECRRWKILFTTLCSSWSSP
jgi:hypothetical protein